jgi:hypothetical protein
MDAEELLDERKEEWTVAEKRYHWAITTLVGLLCFALGFVVSAERMRDRVTEHTVQIRQMESSLLSINAKLDLILNEGR